MKKNGEYIFFETRCFDVVFRVIKSERNPKYFNVYVVECYGMSNESMWLLCTCKYWEMAIRERLKKSLNALEFELEGF